MNIEIEWDDNGKPVLICAWFGRCVRPAVKAAPHPAFGHVPICQECADKMEIDPATLVDFEIDPTIVFEATR